MVTKRHQRTGNLVGIAMTALTALLFAYHKLDFAENVTLDLRQRHCNRMPAHERIAHVDIDDGSVKRIGRWPWRQDLFADLLRIIHEAGAAVIGVDLLYDKPERPLPEDAEEAAGLELAGRSASQPAASQRVRYIYPDLELADAIRHAGNVFLAMQLRLAPPGTQRTPTDELALRLVQSEPGIEPDALAGALSLSLDEARKHWAAARMAQALMHDFTLDEHALAGLWADISKRLGERAADLRLGNVLAMSKRTAARLRVAELMHADAATRDETLYRKLGLEPEDSGPDHEEIRSARQEWLGLRAMQHSTLPMPPDLVAEHSAAAPPVGLELVTPHYQFAQAATGLAAVTFDPDSDGIMRRLPLVVNVDSRALPHLGVAMAAAVCKLDLRGMHMSGSNMLEIPAQGQPPYRVPLDENGRLIVHWSTHDAGWRTDDTGRHLPAAKLLEVVFDRRAMEQNERRAEYLSGQIVDRMKGNAVRNGTRVDLAGEYAARVEKLMSLRREVKIARLTGKAAAPETAAAVDRMAQLSEEVRQEAQKQTAFARRNLADAEDALRQLAAGEYPLEAGEKVDDVRADFERERERFALATKDADEVQRLLEKNGRLAKRVQNNMQWLGGMLRDKYVFVGYTATAEGDIVPSAIDGRMPGVLAHSSVLNNFLQRRFVFVAPRWVEAILILVMGSASTFLTASRGFRGTVLSVTLLLLGYVALNAYVLFRVWDVKLELASVVAVILVTSVPVTFYRWWTSDTQRREIRGQLAQYTSTALASRIADDPEFVEHWTKVEPREVTCFVSDLKGFTTMAEQIDDPARTRAALNIYLDRMSEALDRHQALINKFMGDGIFAFFNPPVLPQPDSHAREACEAGLDCLAALDRLKREQAAAGGDDLIQRFEMRIGLATGIAGVGDFGSSRKKDYTVIGDVANLAARLESANKVFGTSLMLAGTTRETVADQYEFRYLADLQVKGKNRTVPVYELMGRKGNVPDDLLMNAEAFALGVDMYRRREWDACVRHFTRLLSRRPDDPGPAAYIDACHEKKMFPPDDDWAGALELKEK